MKSRTWMRRFGRDASFDDLLAAARAEHGTRASTWLAARLQVSQRTAQRYLAGTQRPSRRTAGRIANVRRAVGRRAAAAQIRRVRTVNVGRVPVYDLSGGVGDGYRTIGTVDVTAVMDRVADLYEQGRDEEAEELFDNAVIAAYAGESDISDDSGLASVLAVQDYRNGINYTAAAPPAE